MPLAGELLRSRPPSPYRLPLLDEEGSTPPTQCYRGHFPARMGVAVCVGAGPQYQVARAMSDHQSARDLVQRWQAGDQAAADELYRRYAQRLCALAAGRIDRRLGRRVAADDIVQSVFRTFFRRAARGEYPIDHSGTLWSLLVQITLRKVQRQRERHHAGKRNVGAEVEPDGDQPLPEAVAHEPTAEEVVSLLDEMRFLLAGLQPPEPQIVQLCFDGHSTPEIAQRVGCSRWTVRRVLDRVGHRLQRRLADPAES
jgi:RNA polymerase sigma factor (sigma-70 family)